MGSVLLSESCLHDVSFYDSDNALVRLCDLFESCSDFLVSIVPFSEYSLTCAWTWS